MGAVFPAMFAPGIVLHTAFPTNVHLDHILLGNMFGVGQGDLTTAAALALPVITILALTVVPRLPSVGLILAIGLLVAPGAIAFLIPRSLGAILIAATLICLAAMLSGIRASCLIVSARAPAVILILTAIFLLAFVARVIRARPA